MQGWICAYCGAEERAPQVDHFRPRKGYGQLAYEFTNLLFACGPCNTTKGSRFPLQGAEVPILYDPATDDVDPRFGIDDRGCVIPEGADEARTIEVIEFFRMNRRPLFVHHRFEVLRQVRGYVQEGRSGEAGLLAIRHRPHSIAARSLLARLAPESLPSPTTELAWLVTRLAEELDCKRGLPKLGRVDRIERDMLAFALAALWKSPPVGTGADVEALLAHLGLAEFIRRYFLIMQYHGI
jgi:uncharacterized protein (TIGR02646 family)